MKQTELLFFFDTEDFTCDLSQTAAMRLADICTEEGVTGHFAVVGRVAEYMRATGRTDVIAALKRHEIGSHTWAHTVHPDICELTDCADFDEAYRRVSEQEGHAIDVIKEVFGLGELIFAVPPGNAKSYAAMYYYADAGIPFYCDTVVCDAQGTNTRCVNAMHIEYNQSVEEIAFGGSVEAALNQNAGRDRVIIYTHPNMAYFSEFWDALNFGHANLHDEGDYVMARRRTEEETARYFDTFRRILRAAKADPRYRITSLREILAAQQPVQPVTRRDIPAIAAALQADYAPIWERRLCLYDVFRAAAAFLCGADAYLPGKAYGLLSAPHELEYPVRLRVDSIRRAAAALPREGFLPNAVQVDGIKLGVGDMLYAMLAALDATEGEITLAPHPPMTFLNRYPQLRDMALRGTWMHTPEFRDDFISERMRLQAYTIC